MTGQKNAFQQSLRNTPAKAPGNTRKNWVSVANKHKTKKPQIPINNSPDDFIPNFKPLPIGGRKTKRMRTRRQYN